MNHNQAVKSFNETVLKFPRTAGGDNMAGASHGSAGASRSDSAGLGWPPAPQMVVYSMNGCSGSSFLTRTSKDVIRCVQPGRWRFTQEVHDGEQFKGYKNLWYGEIQKENAERTESRPMAQGRIWAEVIRRMRAYAAARGETFLQPLRLALPGTVLSRGGCPAVGGGARGGQRQAARAYGGCGFARVLHVAAATTANSVGHTSYSYW